MLIMLDHFWEECSDAHSKWIDAKPVSAATSDATIEHLQSLFSNYGIPETLVSDNGTAFTSNKFEEFMAKNGIRHIKVAPYHPSSNGPAERAVQIFKEGMKKCDTNDTIECRIARVLFQYRITPHSTTGVSPAELLLGRRLRSHMDLIHPDLNSRVSLHQEKQKIVHDNSFQQRTFSKGDNVYTKNFSTGSEWLPGVIQQVTGPLSYRVLLPDGRVVKRHVDHIHTRPSTDPLPENSEQLADEIPARSSIDTSSTASDSDRFTED